MSSSFDAVHGPTGELVHCGSRGCRHTLSTSTPACRAARSKRCGVRNGWETTQMGEPEPVPVATGIRRWTSQPVASLPHWWAGRGSVARVELYTRASLYALQCAELLI